MPQRPRTPRLDHVARRAGVSTTTASAVLRGVGRFSDETRARVQAAARELGYRVDTKARSLRVGSSPAVGVVVDGLRSSSRAPNHYQSSTLAAMVEALTHEGVAVTTVSAQHPGMLASVPIDAAVVLSLRDDAEAPTGLPSGIPLLLGGCGRPGAEAVVARHDHVSATRTVLDHLRAGGAERPALVTTRPIPAISAQIEAAYAAWCAEQGCDPRLIAADGPQTPQGLAAMVARVRGAGADAIYSFTRSASGFYRAIVAEGLAAPEDVLFAALASGVVEQEMTPSITTLSLQGEETGRILARVALQLVRTGRAQDVDLPFELTPRETSRRLMHS